MNKELIHLVAFWSASFISSYGPITIHTGMRNRLIELLESLPPSFEGITELRRQAEFIGENEMAGVDHPINQAMLAFMVKHEKEFSEEFRTNIDNIKAFFADRQR